MLTLFFYTLLSGITIFLGGLAANYFNHHVEASPVKAEITHFMMSFGWGLILSVLLLLFVPRAMELLSLEYILPLFLLGTVSFFYLDRYLHKHAGNVSMLVVMLMSFFPKSIILGSLIAVEPRVALSLAIFMSLQNFPEAFNAFRDLVLSGYKISKVLVLFLGLSFVGVIGGLVGYFFLQEKLYTIAGLMMFFSGGIIYLMFQDIAPESKLKGSYITSLGATLGFMLGIVVDKVL